MKPVIGTALLGVVSLLLSTTPATALDLGLRQHIFIVGSSTAYPIVSAAAERVARDNAGVTPVVESTGTGGGRRSRGRGPSGTAGGPWATAARSTGMGT